MALMTDFNRIHIIGRQNHGKTTLVAELVREFSVRGRRVGTIKHTHHQHELDTPGKDSHVHRVAGAEAVGILSPSMSAVFLPQNDQASNKEDRYSQILPLMTTCEFVLVEGDSQTCAPKIEVWRAALDTPAIASDDQSILAVVTDDSYRDGKTLVLPRCDVARLAEWIEETVLR